MSWMEIHSSDDSFHSVIIISNTYLLLFRTYVLSSSTKTNYKYRTVVDYWYDKKLDLRFILSSFHFYLLSSRSWNLYLEENNRIGVSLISYKTDHWRSTYWRYWRFKAHPRSYSYIASANTKLLIQATGNLQATIYRHFLLLF